MKIPLVILLSCLLAAAGSIREVYNYRQRTGDRESMNTWSREVKRQGRVELTALKPATGESDKMICDADYETLEWFYSDRKRDISIHAVRDGDVVRVTGEKAGKAVSKSVRLETAAWFQFPEFSISRMLASPRESVTYSLFWPDRMTFYVMKASRAGGEKIMINGSQVDTIRVKVTLAGFGSIFWSSRYWFRSSDLVFVRYEGVNGLPGTNPTVLELTGQ